MIVLPGAELAVALALFAVVVGDEHPLHAFHADLRQSSSTLLAPRSIRMAAAPSRITHTLQVSCQQKTSGASFVKRDMMTHHSQPLRDQGGVVHGATDELGFHAVENRHYVTDVHATILKQLRLDLRKLA